MNEWKFQNEEMIEQILVDENVEDQSYEIQKDVILRKINCAMIYYLIEKCNRFKIYCYSHQVFEKTHFLNIDMITQRNKIVLTVMTHKMKIMILKE